MSGDVVASRIQGQEFAHSRHLRRFAQSLERNALRDLLEVFGGKLVGHVRLNESRADGVDGDSSGGEFLGVGHTHGDDTSLGGSVVGLSGISDLSHHGRDVDNPSGSLLHGELEEGLRAVEDSAEVGIDDGLPCVGFHSHDKAIAGDSGVVDQDIDGSKGFDRLGEEFLDLLGIGGCFVLSNE